MITRKILFSALAVIMLMFSACSSSSDNKTITVKPGEIVPTLTVEKGQKAVINGEVKTLNVNGGDVVVGIDGKVGTITVAATASPYAADKFSTITINSKPANIGTVTNLGKAKIYWSAYNQTEATTVLAKPATVNSGLLIAESFAVAPVTGGHASGTLVVGSATDSGYAASDYDGYLIDGQDKVITGHGLRNILLVMPNKVVIKNLTIAQTTALQTSNPANGITFYRAKDGVLENVTLTNCGKAGVIMAASTATATNLNIKGSIWGSVNVSLGGDTVGEEAPGFNLVSGKLEDNYKIYVDLDSFPAEFPKPNYTVTVPSGWDNKKVTKGTQNMQVYYPKGQEPK